MQPHYLAHFETQRYYQNEPRFHGVHSKNCLHNNTKDVAYVINFDGHKSVGTRWKALYVNGSDAS